MGDLVLVREELSPIMAPMAPILEQLLPPALPPERLLQTLYVSCANNASLMQCGRPSLIQAASSAAVLALEIDGVSGQGYLVPFKRQAQFVSGYKGMVTIAGRARRTLEGFIVREGEAFEFDEANGIVRHRRSLEGMGRRIVAAYAVSRAEGLPTIVRVMGLDELIAVRNASAGWRAKGEKSTWGTNFESMCRKTPMRRLSNDLPVLGLQQAAALETQHDLGRHAWLHHDGGVVVDGRELDPAEAIGDVREPRPREQVRAAQPGAGEILDGEIVGEWVVHIPGRQDLDGGDVVGYERKLVKVLERCPEGDRAAIAEANAARVSELIDTHPEVANRLVDVLEAAKG